MILLPVHFLLLHVLKLTFNSLLIFGRSESYCNRLFHALFESGTPKDQLFPSRVLYGLSSTNLESLRGGTLDQQILSNIFANSRQNSKTALGMRDLGGIIVVKKPRVENTGNSAL
jgi:hypothetical protein